VTDRENIEETTTIIINVLHIIHLIKKMKMIGEGWQLLAIGVKNIFFV